MRYAVVFKTHAWDGFMARQLDRYRRRMGPGGDLHVIVDETNGPAGPIDHDRVLRCTQRDMVALGLADRFERGSLIWWCTDYPNHLFVDRHPDYDFYLFVEYDTVIQRDLDGLVEDAAARQADLVALPTRTPKERWMWTRFHLPTYGFDELTGSLNCICLVSNRCAHMLFRRRREMSVQPQTAPFWPGNEVFIATETRRAGMNFVPLQTFGDVDGFEWHPPHLEDDVDRYPERMFLHPVLDRARYIGSLLKFEPSLPGYLLPRSKLRQELARFPDAEYRRLLLPAFGRRLRMRARERLQSVGARLARAAAK